MNHQQKIVHVSSVHQARDNRILHRECRSLAEAGFAVTLVAHAERDGSQHGVGIQALPPSRGGRLRRMTHTVWQAFRMALAERSDAYHLHDPELIPVGLALKALGKRVVFDSHEHVADQIRTKPWIPSALRVPVATIYTAMERATARAFDAIVVATPRIAEAFPGRQPVVVQNFPRAEELSGTEATPYSARGNVAAYVGGITELRGIVEMIRAVELAGRRHEVTLKLGGTFAPAELEAQARAEPGWRNVEALGWLGRGDVARVLDQSRMGLVVLLPAPNYAESQPSKLFEYMAAGLPVVASDFPHWRQFVTEIGSGLMVNPRDPEAIAEAITWLLEHPAEAEAMGRRGRQAVLERFTWEREAEKLVDLYRTRVFSSNGSQQ